MQASNKKLKLSRDQIQPVIIILTLIVACLAFSLVNPSFLTGANLHSILLTAVPVGLIAIGECACIMAGYFDMSVGMVAAMGGLTVGFIMKAGGSVGAALLGGVALGLVCGVLAGLCVAFLNMNAFITTFALQSAYRGVIYIFTEGFPVSMFGPEYESFTRWGQLKVFGFIQFPIVALIVIYVALALFLKYRKLGRSIYLVGSNQKCAHICGIHVRAVQMFIFLLCDLLAAVAGMLYASRVASAQPFMGELMPMEAIAATIVGGTSMAGGKGNLALTFIGVLVIYVVKNGLIMAGLPDFYQYIAIGIILYLAVLAQVEHKKN